MNGREKKPVVDYTPLHLQSHYSLLTSPQKMAVASPSELVSQSQKSGYQKVALTDTNFTSLGRFIQAGRETGVETIPGIELPIWVDDETEPTYLTFLAQNNPGLYLLYQWSTAIGLENKRITPFDIYNRKSDQGIVTFWRNKHHYLTDYLSDDSSFFALDEPTAEMRKQAKQVEALSPEKLVVMHQVLLAQATQLPIWSFLEATRRKPDESVSQLPLNATLKTPLEIAALYHHLPGAVERTTEIADTCQVSFPTRPETKAVVTEGEDSYIFLERLVRNALHQRQADGRNLEGLTKRAEHELHLIKQMDLADCLLISYEIAQYCLDRNIEFMVSGSGNNSVILWLMDVVRIDPQSLLFERFINAERTVGLPDIDFLLPPDKVAELMDFLMRRYPEEAQRLTVIKRLRRKTLVALAKKADYKLSPTDQQQIEAAELPIESTTHPSGIGFDAHMPLHIAGKETVVSQWDKDDVEKYFNRYKFDLLSSDAVGHIHDTKNSLRKQGIPHKIVPEQNQVLRPLFDGNTIAITTTESPHMQQVLIDVGKLASDYSVTLVSQALALARLEYSARDEFLRNQSSMVHPFAEFPEIAAILEDTHYTAIYQEQLMNIALKVAGLPLADANRLRKMMSEKTTWEDKQVLLGNLQRSLVKLNYPQAVIDLLKNQLLHFNSYSFVEGHSLALAQLAYDQSFLLYEYPIHYWAAVLKRLGERQSPMLYPWQVYFNEMKRAGIPLIFPAEKLPYTSQVRDGMIIPGRKLFGKDTEIDFYRKYDQFLDLLHGHEDPTTLVAFQLNHFSAVLTHNPVSILPEHLHFNPEKDQQEIIGCVVVKRRFKDAWFVTIDSNELVHATIAEETLMKLNKAAVDSDLKSGSYYRFTIGRSRYRDNHWIILNFFPESMLMGHEKTEAGD